MRLSHITPATIVKCACGCGGDVKTRFSNGRPILFKPGHHKVKNGHVLLQHPLPCKGCGTVFTPRTARACDCNRACYWKARGCFSVAPKGNWIRKKNRTEFIVVTSPRIQRQNLFLLRNSCEACGWNAYPNVLELHHINHNKRDGRLENLRFLCPTCHEVHHFIEKSGRHDVERYRRARALRERLGLPSLPQGETRTMLQQLVDSGKLTVN